ncbi:hypothetical protein [Chryseobacterium sp. IT-36CA2]|uniref:hypothetical protein n=1 Tax=Chryseobacterium sp. IT-36CA2 TaxID=3026460 RepID=UPI0039E0DB53
MKLNFRNDKNVKPPGSITQLLSHPYYQDWKSIEISIFNDHRYAFFFWNCWTQKLIEDDRINYSPSLVSLDWHQDLVYPTTSEKEMLKELDLNNNKDVALYCWANLSHINDTHIMAAAYLNIIGDIYIHCRQGSSEAAWNDEQFIDRYGNIHTVKKFKKYDDLKTCLLNSDENNVYFDIDLDFFTIKNPLQMGSGSSEYTYLSEETIREMLKIDNPLIEWIFQRLQGITIAVEPEHTGGLLNAHKFLKLINNIWFKPSLFTSYPGKWKKETQWRHLKNKK